MNTQQLFALAPDINPARPVFCIMLVLTLFVSMLWLGGIDQAVAGPTYAAPVVSTTKAGQAPYALKDILSNCTKPVRITAPMLNAPTHRLNQTSADLPRHAAAFIQSPAPFSRALR